MGALRPIALNLLQKYCFFFECARVEWLFLHFLFFFSSFGMFRFYFQHSSAISSSINRIKSLYAKKVPANTARSRRG